MQRSPRGGKLTADAVHCRDARRREVSPMRRFAPLVGLVAVLVGAAPALASTYTTFGLTATSGLSPFAGCTADDVAGQEAAFGDRNFLHAEVEPWIDVNPTDPLNFVGGYQQDRWEFG